MKILISLSYYLPNISGLTIYAKNLAEGLQKNGHTVIIITSQYKKELPIRERKDGIEIKRVPVTFRVGKGPIMLRLPLRILKDIQDADVVNCHLPQFESSLIIFIAKLFNKKVITTYQCDISWDKGIYNKIIKIALLSSHIISALLSDKIVALSSDYASNSFLLRLFKNKVVAIYPPVKTIQTTMKVREALQKKIPNHIKYRVGVAGRISAEKGIEYLFEAIPILKKNLGDNFLILVAGPKDPIGEDKYVNRIKDISKKYSSHILFLGVLSEEELSSFYSLIDVFVLPSINSTEAFGMVQVEAMFYKTPVVASDLPGVRVPVSVTGMGELAPIKDSRRLADAITKVLLLKGVYVKNKDRVNKEFAIDRTIHLYLRLMNESI